MRKKNELRVVLTLHLIQRSVAVEVDADDVEPANDRPYLQRLIAGPIISIESIPNCLLLINVPGVFSGRNAPSQGRSLRDRDLNTSWNKDLSVRTLWKRASLKPRRRCSRVMGHSDAGHHPRDCAVR